ncbi:hypothetical protein ABZP36_001806 [Zizania latifolia]
MSVKGSRGFVSGPSGAARRRGEGRPGRGDGGAGRGEEDNGRGEGGRGSLESPADATLAADISCQELLGVGRVAALAADIPHQELLGAGRVAEVEARPEQCFLCCSVEDLPCTVVVGDRSFAVDGFLDDRASQADAFDLVGVPMIDSALAGFNASLVCYSQLPLSGTGKTYTMWGALAAMVDSSSDHADRGIVPRVFRNLFAQIQGIRENSGNGIPVENLTFD